MAKAILLITSGLPNPVIPLTGDQEAKFMELLEISKGATTTISTHGMGGVAVNWEHGHAIIRRGHITLLQSGGHAEYYLDVSGLEEFVRECFQQYEVKAKEREPWWTWHWDYADKKLTGEAYKRIRRWRRGSFLTVYRLLTSDDDDQLWFYGPFDLGVGFSRKMWVDFKYGG